MPLVEEYLSRKIFAEMGILSKLEELTDYDAKVFMFIAGEFKKLENEKAKELNRARPMRRR